MAGMFKVNGQGHRQNNHTIGILDHENMGIALGIVFLSGIVSVLGPFLKNLTMADFYVRCTAKI
jgi:hypothetical protein